MKLVYGAALIITAVGLIAYLKVLTNPSRCPICRTVFPNVQARIRHQRQEHYQ